MKYIIYCRKSSEAEDRQILSIESQVNELKEFSQRQELTIFKVLTESRSAKAPGRPVFSQMMKLIADGKAQGIICWKLDRLTRNPIDSGSIIWAIKSYGIEIITPNQAFRKEDENSILMYLEFGMAQKYIDDLSKNVKRGNRAKLEKGGWPGPAPFGYLNNKADKTITVDQKNFHYIKRVFELYATGGYSTIDISNILYEEGLRTKSGQKVRKGHVHRILKNLFYCGIMFKNGKYYPGNHTSIISKELYDQANDVLTGNFHSKKQKHFFHLRGFVKCENCGCMFTASTKKGHNYYYCTNGKGICEEHKSYLRSEKLDSFVANIFNMLKFDEELVELAYQAAKAQLKDKNHYQEVSKESLQNQLNLLKERQSRLLDSYTAGITPEALYNVKMTNLSNEQIALEMQFKKINQQSGRASDTLEPVKNIFLEANKAGKEYLDSSDERKRKVIEKLLWNLAIKNQGVVSYKLKEPYHRLSLGPKPTTVPEMLPGLDSNQD